MRLIIESWLLLLYFDWLMHFRGFDNLHSVVRQEKARHATKATESAALCHATDLACVFYFKSVLCLQRSAAAAVLLRRHGWAAELVIGTQMLPFQSHAWVEIDGTVVNDKPYITEIFQVLERC